MGYVSHLPHLLAFAYVNLAIHDKNETKNYQELTGGGYRDFTRIAASDPIMWRDIFLGNKDNILTQLDAFSAIIDTYRNILSSEDDGALIDLISKAKDERTRLQEIIKG